MYKINDDLSIHITRGDIAFLNLTATDEDEEPYVFQPGDIVRITVCEKKKCDSVVLQKDFLITSEGETAELFLDEQDTKIGKVISKPIDLWYEVELNPETDPRTIIGYDEEGPKIFRLYPEGGIKTNNEKEGAKK